MLTIEERYRAAFAPDQELARRARALLPDGSSSDSRYIDPFPIYIERAQGAYKYGLNGREFIDYWAGHGALLLGHQPPEIVDAITEQIERGTHYGASHAREIEWANLVCQLIPSAERVRFTNSGTEAVLLAIHLARIVTGKHKILRFSGHYHGWHASVNVGSGEGVTDRATGIGRDYEAAVIVCPNDDLDIVARHLRDDPDIACVILEPTGPCSGVIPLDGDYLRGLRELTAHHGVILIFDEIVTGFRMSPGGAQAHHRVTPDLTTLAKILSGGLPGGALAGGVSLMERLAKHSPNRTTAQAPIAHLGTFNGNPVSAAAGIAMLRQVQTGDIHTRIHETADLLRKALNEVFTAHGLDWAVYGQASCVKLLIGHGLGGLRASEFDATRCDHRVLLQRGQPHLYRQLRLAMLLEGIDLSLSSFVTTAHTAREVQKTASAFERAIARMPADTITTS